MEIEVPLRGVRYTRTITDSQTHKTL